MRVLILGGYGSFGGRLVRLLADEPRLTLIVAGRSLARAQAFRAGVAATAQLTCAAFDRDGDADAQLGALAPDMVVDASGPFQAYGDPYRVVRAALSRGIDYLDLADGSDFVRGIASFDAQAKARGVFVLSGASSFPLLTAAVTRRLSAGMARIEAISAGIAPSPYATLGLNVIRSIASYCGKPFALIRAGRPSVGYGLTQARRFTIAPPGCLPLGNRRFSLVDAPDLQVLPQLWPSLRDVWMGAGTVPEIMHRMLNLFAWGVRLKLLPSLLRLGGVMHWVTRHLRWGEDRGGMFVAVEGEGATGGTITRSWHMIAEGEDGPFIPSMACAAIIRHCLEGRRPVPGARAATGDIELADYERLFATRAIRTGTRETLAPTLPLYRRLLGDAYATLPAPLRAMHDLRDALSAEGTATVMRGTSLLARLAAAIVGFPRAGENVAVRVDFVRENGRERWTRTFAGRAFHSTQEAGQGRSAWLVCERFGPVCVAMALVTDKGILRLVVRRWSLFGIPMPRFLAPGGEAYEYAADGRFHFHVEIGHPFTGLIVAYRGFLVPVVIPPDCDSGPAVPSQPGRETGLTAATGGRH
ncbi:MAG: DUF4166 domain-containing protein [Alphaproteobacteria bacterium]|nr:DUF4166 domain-containing protein [Alphaproteobacteria bacterium]